DLERHRGRRQAAGVLGARAPAGPVDRDLHRARGPRRLLADHQPHDARLRGARGRLQPGGRPLRRHLGRPELLPGDGDRRQLRRARGSARHHRLGVQPRPERHPGEPDRLHRPRGGAARPQHGDRRGSLGAPVRRADQRHLRPPARPVDLPARPRRQPDDDHPGARHPVRRPQPGRDLGVDQAAAEAGDVTALAARLGGIRWTHPRTAGIAGIFLGAVAFWLTLPPLAARTSALPILVGLLAIAAGIWAWARDERRVGGGAVAAGLLGIAFGFLATQSSTAHLDSVVVWSALLAATLRYATPLTYAAIGGLFCERSGVINVALEGMLLTGAFFGIWGAIWAHSWAGGAAW